MYICAYIFTYTRDMRAKKEFSIKRESEIEKGDRRLSEAASSLLGQRCGGNLASPVRRARSKEKGTTFRRSLSGGEEGTVMTNHQGGNVVMVTATTTTRLCSKGCF